MARGSGLRPWKRGTETARAASTTVIPNGDLVITDEGNVYAGDGAAQAKNLQRLAKTSEVALAQSQIAISPLASGAVGDAIVNDYVALTALISAAVTGRVIDLGGRIFRVGQTLSISKTVTIRNGGFICTGNRVAVVTAPNVRMENVSFTRTGTGNSESPGALALNAYGCTLIDVHAVSSTGEGLRLGNGACDGTKVVRGYYESSDANDSYAIHLVSGPTHNYQVTVQDATIRNTGYGTGIGFYNCSQCVVRNTDVRGIRRSPLVTLSGWTLVSGTCYRTQDRTDTATNALYVNGAEYKKNADQATTTPSQGFYTNPGDGYLYLNSGVDPSSQTVTSTRTNGYGILFYATSSETLGMRDNLTAHCTVEDTDGFGIYYQTLQNIPRNNRTLQNTLRGVCKTGVTVNDLPFAGIGVFGGLDVILDGDMIDGAGSPSTPCPGIDFKASVGTPLMSVKIKGVTVRGATGVGISAAPGTFTLENVSAIGNASHAINHGTLIAGDTLDVYLLNCVATNNGGSGAYFETTTTAELRVNITGGKYSDNALRNIALARCRDVLIGGGVLSSGAGNVGVNITSTCLRVILDGIKLRSGVGIVVQAGIAELYVGTITHDGSSGTKVNITGPYRTAGATGGIGQWVTTGTPEGVVTAPIGSMCRRMDGGAGTTLYVKETGTGNTGWVAK